jgi:hypothetical protein
MRNNVNSYDVQIEMSKIKRLKNVIDLVTCELCAIVFALIIDCIIIFTQINSDITLPLAIIGILALIFIATFILRRFLKKRLAHREYSLIKELKKSNSNNDEEVTHEQTLKLMSPMQMVVRRFFRSKLSIIGLVMVISLFLFCWVGPLVYTSWSATDIDKTGKLDYTTPVRVEFTDKDGNSYKTVCRAHGFKGVIQCYYRLADLLDETELSVGNILKAECQLVKAKPMWEKADKKYREDQHWFIDFA